MLILFTLKADVNIYDALKIRSALKLDKTDKNSAKSGGMYSKDGISDIRININLERALARVNERNCQVYVVIYGFKFLSKDNVLDITKVQQTLYQKMMITGVNGLDWSFVNMTFSTTIDTEYAINYLELVKKVRKPKHKNDKVLPDKNLKKSNTISFENSSRNLTFECRKDKDIIRLKLSITNSKLNMLVKSERSRLNSKAISNVKFDVLQAVEKQLWDEYLSQVIGRSDYYSLNAAEKVLRERCSKISNRHRLIAVLKGVSVYKGVDEFLSHVNDEEKIYEFMEEITNISSAQKCLKELEDTYNINPIVLSRRDAADLKIEKLPALISLIDCSVYNTSGKTKRKTQDDNLPIMLEDERLPF